MAAALLLLGIAAAVASAAAECGYESCPRPDPNKLNVHLVAHTHDDVGWLKTVDQYFYGSAKSISPVGVQYILDSVIPELVADPTKRFIYVEMAFFWRWWREQSDSMRHTVTTLVKNGQLEFINGGWCMNDEASTHYNAIIDQMTWGFRKLNDTFGECARPRVAWQIDPFGHSREQANLFAQMGFDGLFFGRLDYADKEKRKQDKTMEMIWKGSDSLGQSSWLFTGALYNGYGPPDGFCFDIFCDDDPIMDDRRLHDYNVDKKVSDFVDAVRKQAEHYTTNNVMLTMGSDFHYTSAGAWFKNLDKLIKYVSANHSDIAVFYSTPSCYLKAAHDSMRTYTTKSDDFFPYASDPHAYWTGYFTSRPALKGMEREGNKVLQVCKQLDALTGIDQVHSFGDVSLLREAMGVLQHHDAVSGTAKQAVTFDYAQRLSDGIGECERIISGALIKLSANSQQVAEVAPEFRFCRLLNVSQCDVTETSSTFVVNVYNPLARRVTKYVRVPIPSPGYDVVGPDGKAVPTQVVPVAAAVKIIPERRSSAGYELVFQAEDIPAIGFKSFYVRRNSSSAAAQVSTVHVLRRKHRVSNGRVSIAVGVHDHSIEIIPSSGGPVVTQEFGFYVGHEGNNSDFDFRASGAYIFRPANQTPSLSRAQASPILYKGPLVKEVHQAFDTNYISQVARLYSGSSDVELDFVVGPIPVGDDLGKEVITRYNTDVKSDKRFLTDSNGRQLLERQRDYRPTWNLDVTEPVAGNYYPVNSRIAVKDSSSGQVTVLTDRSQGGTSLNDGQLELMLHRRLLHDDAFGVDEALNETAFGGLGLVIRGRHWVQSAGSSAEAARMHRLRGQEVFMDSMLAFAQTDLSFDAWKQAFKMEYSALAGELPPNVHVLTLEDWSGNARQDVVLLRLEHIFDVNEDPTLSKPVAVSLGSLFAGFEVTSVEEVILGANLPKDKLARLEWNVELDNTINPSEYAERASPAPQVTLAPMEIKSFIVGLTPKP